MATCSFGIAITVDPAYTQLQAIGTGNMLKHRSLPLEEAKPPDRSTKVSILGQWLLGAT